LEEQIAKHVDLEERLKTRLKELTSKVQEQHEMVCFSEDFSARNFYSSFFHLKIQNLSSKEISLELNNQQLIQDVAEARRQLAIFSMPAKLQILSKTFDTNKFTDSLTAKKQISPN
jgi:hypothetical protein